MITKGLFQTMVFPWVLFDASAKFVEAGEGILFAAPPGTFAAAVLQTYASAPLGWSRCPNGYALYAKQIDFLREHKLVTYGLKIKGISTKQGRSVGLSVSLERHQMEKYINEFIKAAGETRDALAAVLNSSVHEIRHINRDIKGSVQHIVNQESTKSVDLTLIFERSQNIKALSEVLSARTDFLEYLSNPAITRVRRQRTVVFKKFDKVRRSLESRLSEKRARIGLYGSSVGAVNALVVFDVVPYLILENAVKYSAFGHDIRIEAWEDSDTIEFVTRNTGPKLEADELERVFDQGFRGMTAREKEISGSGFGLFFLKELVEVHHRGRVVLEQSAETRLIDGLEYRETAVRLMLPRLR